MAMNVRDMVSGFVPGGLPDNMGRKAKDLARSAVGATGFVAVVAVLGTIVVAVEGLKTLMNAPQKGGRD